MVINEILDTVYDTINLKVNTDGSAEATFRTDIDTYTVHFSKDSPGSINFARKFIPVPMVSISFSSRLLFMGHSSAENVEYTKYVYPTVVKTTLMFVEARKKMHKPVYAITCSVAGDNSRGSKKKIYQTLFAFSSRFGFHKWKDQLIAIQLSTYEKLKKYGFKDEDGNIIKDNEL